MTEEKNSEKPFTVKCPTSVSGRAGAIGLKEPPEARISSIRVTLRLKSRTPAKAGETFKTQATRPELRTLPRPPLQTLTQPEDTPGFRALRRAL